MDLNPVQKEAVEKTDGPIMILAGAGSGKTRTLVSRISYLLKEKDVAPYRLLALTFSNKAAREMRERVASLVDLDIGSLSITTFHSFCVRVLRSEITYLGLSKNFTIYDEAESRAVIKSVLTRRGINLKEISPYEVLYFIDNLKNHGHYVDKSPPYEYEVEEDHEFYPYYLEYEAELYKANALDFGGLICGVIQLFEKYPEVKKHYQERYHYVLVDEYQDTNRAQFELIKILADKRKNICVVGDEDQSIYSWRGADIHNILDFEKVFPDVQILKLEQNYRSSKNIIEAATQVISQNTLRKGKKMWTENPQGDSILVVDCLDDKKEGGFVASEILDIYKKGASFSDIAVFYRANAQSRLIEDHLRANKIPYRIIGGTKFYDRKEVKDMLAYMRLVVNDKDSLALSRIINVPARGIGATTLRKLEEEAVNGSASLWEIICAIVENSEKYSYLKIGAKIKSSLREMVTIISEIKVLESEKVSPVIIYEKLLHDTGYFEFLKSQKDYESLARIENLEELSSAIKQFEQSGPNPTLLGFLETITLDNSSDESVKGEVSLMTVHGAKGLEFPYVFLVGAEENIFPSYKSMEGGPKALEEERRLFYVAMTRAMKKLYITFARGRMLFGQIKFNGPSRFIDEIPSNFYLWHKIGNEDSDFVQEEEDYFSQEPFFESEKVYQVGKRTLSKFETGAKVRHTLYGDGKVLESSGSGDEEKVLIMFSGGVKKKFMVSLAPLVRI